MHFGGFIVKACQSLLFGGIQTDNENKMKPAKKLFIVVLIVLGIAMLFLGMINSMLPPALTGIGFGVISILFLIDSK